MIIEQFKFSRALASQKLEDFCNDDAIIQYLKKAMSSLTGYETYYNGISLPSGRKLTKHGFESIEKYILSDEFLDKYGLAPVMNRILTTSLVDKKDNEVTYTSSNIEDTGTNILDDIRKVPTYLFGENLIIPLEMKVNLYPTGILYNIESDLDQVIKLMNDLKKIILNAEVVDGDIVPVDFLCMSPRGITSVHKELNIDSSFELSEFNEDLPYQEVDRFLNSDENGVLIFHGTPGCGKTSYIKYLMRNHKSDTFAFVSQDILLGQTEDFKSSLLRRKKDNIIYVVEDCEALLRPREKGNANSAALSDILNFLDGVLGGVSRAKFIFTFNTTLNQIDNAVLRRGRCKVNYEFNPLKGEKLINLAEKQGLNLTEDEIKSGLSLADIFHHEDLKCENKKANRVGFL